jgi:hypothetical protein
MKKANILLFLFVCIFPVFSLIAQKKNVVDSLSKNYRVFMCNKDSTLALAGQVKYALFDGKNKQLTEYEYDEIRDLYPDFAQNILSKNHLFALMDVNRKFLTDFIYEKIELVQSERVFVTKKGKCALMNLEGELLSPFIWDSVGIFSFNLAIVKKGNHYGLIDTMGKEILACEYESILDKTNVLGYFL